MKFAKKTLLLLTTILFFCLKVCCSQSYDNNEICTVEPGWYNAENGYQYRKSDFAQTWQESGIVCQSLGGDLAHAGIRNLRFRGDISITVLGDDDAWIGLSDLEIENTFVWIDGVPATAENAGWHCGEPNNYKNKNEDCVFINFSKQTYNTANDSLCGSDVHALCEKPLVPCQ